MPERYSIVFSPPPEVVETIRRLKQELKEKIGWYASVNSEAHITICEFIGENRELEKVTSYLEKFTNGLVSVTVCFNGLDSFPNGAFYLSPDESSKRQMGAMMKSFTGSFPVKLLFAVDNPHMTIGRQLDASSLALGFELFSGRNFDLHYICNSISLRRFNPEKRQFDIVEHFYFKGQAGSSPDDSQLLLF